VDGAIELSVFEVKIYRDLAWHANFVEVVKGFTNRDVLLVPEEFKELKL